MRPWGVMPGIVAPGLIKEARRAVNVAIGKAVINGGGRVGDAYGHTWLPDVREHEAILAMRDSLSFCAGPDSSRMHLVGAVPCEPQIVLGFPLAERSHATPLHTHLDETPPWADGRPYSMIVGVALTKWTPQNGTLHVADEDSVLLAVPLFPGDAVWMKPDVKHTAGHNFTSEVRIGVYFRWLAAANPTTSLTVVTSTK